VFFLPLSHSAPPLPMFPLEFRDKVNHKETRVMELLVVKVANFNRFGLLTDTAV